MAYFISESYHSRVFALDRKFAFAVYKYIVLNVKIFFPNVYQKKI